MREPPTPITRTHSSPDHVGTADSTGPQELDGHSTRPADLFAGPGRMPTLCRGMDWGTTPLGPVATWSEPLRTAAAIVLRSTFPAILVWGPELVQIYNDAYVPLIGVKHPGALGTPTHTTWPEIRHLQDPIFDKVFSGEPVHLSEAPYRLERDGAGTFEELFFDATFIPVPLGDSIGGSLSILEDSTTRVRLRSAAAERELLLAELASERKRLIAAQGVAQIGSWEADYRTGVVSWSDETYRILGLGPGSVEPTHQTFLDLVHPDDRATVDAAFNDSFGTHEIRDVQHRIVLADGTIKQVEERWHTVVEQAGQPLRAIGTCQDITARWMADSVLRQLATALEHLTDQGVAIMDGSGQFLYANSTHARILGHEQTAVSLLNTEQFIPDRDAQCELRGILDQAQHGTSWSGLVRRRRASDGQIIMVDMIIGAIPERGRTLFFTLVHDATDRLAREAHLRRIERVAGMGTLIAGVAHELNNPLSAILGFTHLLLLDPRPEEDREDLAAIAREAQRMARIVADLKVVTRQTQDETHDERVDVNEVIRHVLKTRSYALSTHNIEVRVDLADDLPSVRGDRAQMEQVLVNLVVNAEQAMREGGSSERRLIVRTRETAHGCSIHVIDNGPGIPGHLLNQIFDPFFTTKAPGEGTGLGLALVQSTIAEHHGEIRVDSEVGNGAAFRIDLPRGEQPSVIPVPTTALIPAVKSLLILVVDDEEPLRRVLVRSLTRRGHTVHEAVDGRRALELIDESNRPYDFIVSDLRMPGLGGEALLERLKERNDGMARRIIFLTGDTASSDTTGVRASAAVPILAKPIEMTELIRLVEKGVATQADDDIANGSAHHQPSSASNATPARAITDR